MMFVLKHEHKIMLIWFQLSTCFQLILSFCFSFFGGRFPLKHGQDMHLFALLF